MGASPSGSSGAPGELSLLGSQALPLCIVVYSPSQSDVRLAGLR